MTERAAEICCDHVTCHNEVRKARAEELEAAADAIPNLSSWGVRNWLRVRAAALRGETDE